MKKLSIKEIKKELELLEGWSHQEENISKTFIFKDFIEAFGFMGKVAIISEKLNHHPDWSGVYNRVVIKLSTHEAGSVTSNDIKFAKLIEKHLA